MDLVTKKNHTDPTATVENFSLTAEEFNQLPAELEYVITQAGLTPSASDLTQVYKAIINLSTPAGTILDFAGSTAPSGYLLADGSNVSRTTYSRLFTVIGTTYGSGDGSTTFGLPDLRGRVTIGLDGEANRITSASTGGANADTLGGVGGSQTHTLTVNELPQVTIRDVLAGPGSTLENAVAGENFDLNTRVIGGGLAHSNTQPWIAVNRIIKT